MLKLSYPGSDLVLLMFHQLGWLATTPPSWHVHVTQNSEPE